MHHRPIGFRAALFFENCGNRHRSRQLRQNVPWNRRIENGKRRSLTQPDLRLSRSRPIAHPITITAELIRCPATRWRQVDLDIFLPTFGPQKQLETGCPPQFVLPPAPRIRGNDQTARSIHPPPDANQMIVEADYLRFDPCNRSGRKIGMKVKLIRLHVHAPVLTARPL